MPSTSGTIATLAAQLKQCWNCQHSLAPPNIRADFSEKAGIGYARFGNSRKAETLLRQALESATAHGLHEVVFRIEPILDGAQECGAPDHLESAAPQNSFEIESLKEVSASLAMLGADS